MFKVERLIKNQLMLSVFWTNKNLRRFKTIHCKIYKTLDFHEMPLKLHEIAEKLHEYFWEIGKLGKF
jgi:hypothetical protein